MNITELANALQAQRPHLQVTAIQDETFTLEVTCPLHSTTFKQNLKVLSVDVDAWLNHNAYAQNIWGPKTAELMMTGICNNCWESLFADVPDEENDSQIEDDFFGTL